ncbi:MAG: VanZ family protein [Sphingobacteriaceae bacterium]
MLRTLRHQILAIAWSAIILVLCNLPAEDLPQNSPLFFEGFDKLVHTGFFFVLSVLLFYGKIRQQQSYQYRFLTIIKIFLISAALGAAIELMQWKWFTYRSADWLDFFCDLLGVAMGTFSYVFLHRIQFNEK